ncbi:hypothetical protein L7F22_006774 [Adiantum nelumboides]|nr:hypothetical protein [Adiantum nelumboides]
MGAVLQQDSRHVAFYSKKVDSTQCNYSIYDKELFTIILALKHWKHFLCGKEFTVKTHHQALKWLQTMPSADFRDSQGKWSQIFQQYGGMIKYLLGKNNLVADALSRKSSLVQAIQPLTILEIQGMDLDCIKREYPDSVEFSTPYNLATASHLFFAIEACKEQLALYHSSSQRQLQELVSCSFNDTDSIMQKNDRRGHDPVSKRKQFDPVSSDTSGCEQVRVIQAFGDGLKFRNTGAAEQRSHCPLSLEEGSQASGRRAKPILAVKKNPGGAFVPYNRLIQPIPRPGAIDPTVFSLKCADSEITGPPNEMASFKLDVKCWENAQRQENSSAGVGLHICSKNLPNLQQQLRQGVSEEKVDNNTISSESHAPRKARRSWSPELHRLFVDALQKLGGAQATPKQIRELMNVEGLTNDEVKSHLQKYRLHARRLGASTAKSSSQSSGEMSADRAYVSTDYVLHARGAPISYDCNLSGHSKSCETSITQGVVYYSTHSRDLPYSQASSCCRKQSTLLPSRHLWQGSDVGGEESVGEAARPKSSGSKSRQMHESDEMQEDSVGEETLCYEGNESRFL